MTDKLLWGMCSAHKTASEAYREGWERIWGEANIVFRRGAQAAEIVVSDPAKQTFPGAIKGFGRRAVRAGIHR
jgi:hypothetical protein